MLVRVENMDPIVPKNSDPERIKHCRRWSAARQTLIGLTFPVTGSDVDDRGNEYHIVAGSDFMQELRARDMSEAMDYYGPLTAQSGIGLLVANCSVVS